MKIAIIGYGKMGRMIERLALAKGDDVVCRIDVENPEDFNSEAFRKADVAIEFSTPATAKENVLHCFAARVPVVCGTTGWNNDLEAIERIARAGEGVLFHSTNFSIGVNIFNALNRYLSRIMNGYKHYQPSIKETHHIHKLDHPSGTAITLAEELIANCDRIESWREVDTDVATESSILGIEHERRGEVPGIHTITWNSDVDTISLTHSAKSREGFAAGALVAAEWLIGKPAGVYGMNDMLKF